MILLCAYEENRMNNMLLIINIELVCEKYEREDINIFEMKNL